MDADEAADVTAAAAREMLAAQAAREASLRTQLQLAWQRKQQTAADAAKVTARGDGEAGGRAARAEG